MLEEYKVNRSTRQCFDQKRPLKEGEWYYSVVIGDDKGYQRRDYSAEAWESPPEGAVGFWKCQMPLNGERKMVLAPREVLIDLLRQMESDADQAKLRFLLALMLLRRRFVRVIDSATPASDELKFMNLEVVDDGTTIEVLECKIGKTESEALSESLVELLYCEASETETAD
ncbi:hypothetical protein LOC67_21040 [Stieleria sp. JC731]|uniref:hypothetical protein n=1 Tax=Pirellulaceae TaxID=2691357 RepID=UPI001E36FA67|nr:hypothetical protein [Stieleria sp. JC731]MCC9603042.1 hypothetical protein [Stieleria sp. JC731]